MQSLVSLVSLAILQVPAALSSLSQLSTSTGQVADSTDSAPYILNVAAVNEVNDTLIDAGSACLLNASPAVLGWGIIMQTMRELALSNKETRELRQSHRAIDKYGNAEPSDTDGGEKASQRHGAFITRRSSTGSDSSQQASLLEELLDQIMDTALDQDPIAYLARSAVDGSHVLNVIATLAVDFCTPFGREHAGKVGIMMRRVLLTLLRAVPDWIPYQPEVLLATLAVLTGSERYWDLWDRPLGNPSSEPAQLFLDDDLFLQKILVPAQSRFPHESLPFFKLCRALATCTPANSEQLSPIWHKIESIDSFTCALPAEFKGYELIREDEDANYIQLTEDFAYISHRSAPAATHKKKSMKMSRALTATAQTSCVQELPSGTIGRVVSETRPFVVLWRYDYPGLEYIGKVLKLASLNDDMTGDASYSGDVVAEVIDLINTMVRSSMRADASNQVDNGVETARSLIEKISDGLDRNGDVITLVFGILEDELYRRRKISEDEGPGHILIRCTQFAYTMLHILPDRVWPYLGRSGLLGVKGGESQLHNIISATEMVTGQYEFLLGCVRLFEGLVQDAISHAVSRKVPTKAVARFGALESMGTGVSQAAMRTILLAFTRSMLDVFQSTMNWRFVDPEERLEINSRICAIFENILNLCYAVDDSTPITQKLAEAFAPSAEHLLNTFIRSNVDTVFSPLLHIFLEGTATQDINIVVRDLYFGTSQVKAAIKLSTTLVRVSYLLQGQPGPLEKKLFGAVPVLAQVYAAHESYKVPTMELFEALVTAVAVSNEQPPSLLSHLGQGAATHFLELLSALDRPFDNVLLSVGIWRFLSAIVSKRQQWFAIFVLTGTSPRETFKDHKKEDKLRAPEPILGIALDELSNISGLQPQKALSMLEFIALALDNWPWIMTTIEQHPRFLDTIQSFLSDMAAPPREEGPTFSDYVKIQICSYIVEILAIACHHTQQIGNVSFTKKLIPKLTYLTENAVSVPHYNSSLHGNLRKNVESKFPTCFLVNFKRTTLKRPFLGQSFLYDLDIAGQMLSYDTAWTGRQGFLDEFKRANINMSLVESQINLLYSWKCLAIQLSRSVSPDLNFQKVMIRVIMECLKSNIAESSTNLAVFEKLAQTRAELAFALLQRLAEASCTDLALQHVLPVAWDTLRKYDINIEAALRGENADYYRLLMKILLLALQGHIVRVSTTTSRDDNSNATHSPTSAETIQIILEIITLVVARGFRGLTTLLHDTPSLVEPSDFAILTAILRTTFQIPGVTRNTTHLQTSFSDASTARCASTLLSWSDQLTTNQDPIYGELSILFLLELSNIPSIAESLAVEGVLPHITSTNLMKYLRQPKALGPLDAPIRMYSIWSRGLLPLFMNLLHSVGPPIAAEIAGLLNSFPEQLARASNSFDTDAKSAALTLSMISEAQNLAVITAILDTFREAGASAGIVAADVAQVKWNRAQVKDDIETWVGKRAMLRDAIVPTTESEEHLLKTPANRNAEAESRLEEKIVEAMKEVLSLLDSNEQ